MGKATGATPDRHNELFDQLRRFVTPIGTRRGQSPTRQRLPKSHRVQHALQQGQPTPRSDFPVGKADGKAIPFKSLLPHNDLLAH